MEEQEVMREVHLGLFVSRSTHGECTMNVSSSGIHLTDTESNLRKIEELMFDLFVSWVDLVLESVESCCYFFFFSIKSSDFQRIISILALRYFCF